MGPIEVIVRRGGVVEATHIVHAVAVRDGAVERMLTRQDLSRSAGSLSRIRHFAQRIAAAGALAVFLSACGGTERDSSDQTSTPRRSEAVIDVRKGSYRGVQLEDSRDRLVARFGRGPSFDPERDAATTLANPDGSGGAPSHLGGQGDAYAWSVHRYQHLVAFVVDEYVSTRPIERYVHTLLIDDPVAATTDGVAIGDPLERVKQVYENATCGLASSVAEESDYPACSLTIGPHRHVWFGPDPIETITLTVLLSVQRRAELDPALSAEVDWSHRLDVTWTRSPSSSAAAASSRRSHVVHAVAVRDGAVVEQAGDPERVAFLRSSAKPFQALPLVRARDDLTTEEIAIASASHLASPEQLAAVRSLLAKAPAQEDELECGPLRSQTALQHNCSGKHAGMLALCRTKGWASGGYRLATHPVQHGCLHEVAAAADVDPEEIPTAIDGCGVLTFALPLERMALMFARLEQVDGGARVAAAMRAHPELIRGPMAADSLLMRELDGWTAKGGAEGLLCASGPGGLGIALKIEDGSMRAMRPALAELLQPTWVRDRRAGHRAARELARRDRRRDRLGAGPLAG